MLYEENCQLGFAGNKYDPENADIMFAYEEDEQAESETNYYTYQQEEFLAFPEKKPIQKESLTFTNNDSGGLPNYFGDAP